MSLNGLVYADRKNAYNSDFELKNKPSCVRALRRCAFFFVVVVFVFVFLVHSLVVNVTRSQNSYVCHTVMTSRTSK